MSGLPNKELLRTDEVAEFLRITRKQVYEYIDDGTLEAVRLAGKRLYRIRRESVIRLLIPTT